MNSIGQWTFTSLTCVCYTLGGVILMCCVVPCGVAWITISSICPKLHECTQVWMRPKVVHCLLLGLSHQYLDICRTETYYIPCWLANKFAVTRDSGGTPSSTSSQIYCWTHRKNKQTYTVSTCIKKRKHVQEKKTCIKKHVERKETVPSSSLLLFQWQVGFIATDGMACSVRELYLAVVITIGEEAGNTAGTGKLDFGGRQIIWPCWKRALTRDVVGAERRRTHCGFMNQSTQIFICTRSKVVKAWNFDVDSKKLLLQSHSCFDRRR